MGDAPGPHRELHLIPARPRSAPGARRVDDFTHWLLWNIPATTTHLNEAASARPSAGWQRQIVTATASAGPASAIAVRVRRPGRRITNVFEIFRSTSS